MEAIWITSSQILSTALSMAGAQNLITFPVPKPLGFENAIQVRPQLFKLRAHTDRQIDPIAQDITSL